MSEVETPPTLLDRPAEEAARLLVAAALDRATAARRALAEGTDPEALHDFRVALRRTRSLLRAFESGLEDAVPARLARRLGRLAASTGSGRDAEVGLDWLARLAPARRPSGGAAALAARFRAERSAALGGGGTPLLASFDRIELRLRERLASPGDEPARAPAAPFRSLLARELASHGAALERALDAIEDRSAEDQAHAARIEAKRLRYLVDSVALELPGSKRTLALLKKLQELLGDLNDLAVLAREIARCGGRAERRRLRALAAGDAEGARAAQRGRTGLGPLAVRLAEARSERWQTVERDWMPEVGSARVEFREELATLQRTLAPEEPKSPEPAPEADPQRAPRRSARSISSS